MLGRNWFDMQSCEKMDGLTLKTQRPEICEKHFLSFPQKIYKLINLRLSQFVYFLKELCLKFGYSEKATKFEKIFHLKFDANQ